MNIGYANIAQQSIRTMKRQNHTNDNICVAHLVRRNNSLDVLQTFVASYQRYESGEMHDLLIIYKGFKNEADKAPVKSIVDKVEHLDFDVPDEGFDIDVYWLAFKSFQRKYGYFLFLNSHSEIVKSNWLKCYSEHIRQPGVGIVGATGSYQSISSDCRYPRFLESTDRPIWSALVRKMILFLLRIIKCFWFPPYPKAHIRTNAFMLSTRVMEKITFKPMKKKTDTYRFESGKDSLTQQIVRLDLSPLVVGKDGRGYGVEEWYRSNTFWRSEQENLLIKDNQTRAYDDGDLRQKTIYSNYAWKEKGCPNLEMLHSAEGVGIPRFKRR